MPAHQLPLLVYGGEMFLADAAVERGLVDVSVDADRLMDDAIAEGKHKALIILGHIPSEQAGMEECTRWLKDFVTEVPVNFVPSTEPFWAPASK